MFSNTLHQTGFEISTYPITAKVWRWEVRANGALVRCGTTKPGTAVAAARRLFGLSDEGG
jgi:hypothetical protein